MGWKANCLLLSETGGPVFADYPPHQPDKALAVLDGLGLAKSTRRGETDFLEAVHLTDGSIGIGAYPGGLILCGLKIDHPENKSVKQTVDALFRLYPSASILELGLHSVVNYYHYKLWVAGRLVRHRAGSADDGVVADVGELLPEEEPHFKNSELRGEERVFIVKHDGHTHEYDHSAYGESLLFSVAARFLGDELNACEIERLKIELFTPPGNSHLTRHPLWKFWRWGR
jgi:hypothetical protein